MSIKNHVWLVAILTVMSLTISSCDCHQVVEGVVLDKTSQKPIDSVSIHKVGMDREEFCDSAGSFKISATDGGLFGCPVMNIVLEKKGYDSITETIASGDSKTIFMERSRSATPSSNR